MKREEKEHMNEAIVRLHRAKIVPVVLSILFGAALVIARRSAMDAVIRIAAALLVIGGVGSLCLYFFGPIRRENTQLAVGVLLAGTGVLLWLLAGTLVDIFPGIAGVTLILNAFSNLGILSSPEEQTDKWVVLLVSALMAVGGLTILLHPRAIENILLIFIGLAFIVNGILDLVLMHLAKEALLRSFTGRQE